MDYNVYVLGYWTIELGQGSGVIEDGVRVDMLQGKQQLLRKEAKSTCLAQSEPLSTLQLFSSSLRFQFLSGTNRSQAYILSFELSNGHIEIEYSTPHA